MLKNEVKSNVRDAIGFGVLCLCGMGLKIFNHGKNIKNKHLEKLISPLIEKKVKNKTMIYDGDEFIKFL